MLDDPATAALAASCLANIMTEHTDEARDLLPLYEDVVMPPLLDWMRRAPAVESEGVNPTAPYTVPWHPLPRFINPMSYMTGATSFQDGPCSNR